MNAQKQQKKLPKRTSSAARKAYRARAWIKQQKAKRKRIDAQKEREHDNRHLREDGKLTPWQEAKAVRFARRHG